MLKLNLGCGPHAMMDWINYDIKTEPGSMVIRLDLSQGQLPHRDSSVDHIFSEHFIEHITRPQCERLMRDCLRVLRPGGIIRLSTPDLRYLCARYMTRDTWSIPGIWEPKGPCAMMNEGMRLWDHQWLYDAEDITELLRSVGFGWPRFYKWKDSDHSELRGLEIRTDNKDLIIEACKE